ncbi:hypothetical protein AUC61_00785 [Pseudomonas sp. S25]|uniref:Lipopolysaccharide biosynthesis protein, LPS:glycosyltransferase n=1 Tax=Pseudomonas maioricensis TaxID=1766623 RepID=A0ABS9ZCR7_9PSED|nr:hypothetical protein [Pseudomonas sp. S25]MCI8208056.1 hypothetical protein [Pseudomonas sp. S25]
MTSPADKVTSTPQLIYLVFGARTYHQEAVFSIASALACMRRSEQALDIQVFTDDPLPYQDLPVRIRALDPETREAWSAPHGYHFRTKHVVLRLVLEESERALLIDTDTIFNTSPLALFDRVKPGTLLCNAINKRYGTNPDSKLYKSLSSILLARGLADDEMPMLNSGVIGLMREDAHVLDRSIALMDELFPLARNSYSLEEFCLAMAAYKSMQIAQCPDLIHHYWSRKQLFRAKINAWLLKHAENPASEDALDDTSRVSAEVPRPPIWQRQLYKMATLLAPEQQRQFTREILYGCYAHSNEFDLACCTVWWDKARENAEQRQNQLFDARQLEEWLNHWVLRAMLGQRRKAVHEHLMQRETR